MRTTTAIGFAALLLLVACTSSKKSSHIVAGNDFLYDSVHTDTEDESLVEFLNYSTYFHIINDSDLVETQNRPGVLLSAKNTSYLNWNGEAAFGNPGDTCWINYRSHNEKVLVGRSAAISVFNFFNNDALGNQPDEYFNSKELNGSIKFRQTVVPFHFHQIKTEGWKSKGWMVMERDSLFLKPALKNGKGEKKQRNLELVKKGSDTPIAALDFQRQPRMVYLRKNLTATEKSLVSSYIFILLCYLK